jgi:hypothetical protein
MELRRIPGDPRINPARGGGGKEASRGWKGMQSGSPRKALENFPQAKAPLILRHITWPFAKM